MQGPYRVLYSSAVQSALKELLTRASLEDTEFGNRALAAVKTCDERLRTNPKGLGEPCYLLRQLRLEVRLGIVAPLAVSFAVHESEPLVIVTGYRLLGRSKK